MPAQENRFWGLGQKPIFLTAACGRGCVKTQERHLEVDFRLCDFSVEVSRLLAGRNRLLSQLVASNDVFEGDFWGEIVVTFSHSLGR